MTIAAAYLTSEGIVLGADSTTTIESAAGGDVVQLFNHSQKVFEIGQQGMGRMGLCTFGDGVVGSMSHRTLVARLSESVTDDMSVRAVVDEMIKLVKSEILPARPLTGMGILLGGWNFKTRRAECYRVVFKGLEVIYAEPLAVGQAVFDGVGFVASRIISGSDKTFLYSLLAKIEQECPCLPPEFRDAFLRASKSVMKEERSRSRAYFDLPLREAIDFVHTHLHATVKSLKFRAESAVCGGPLEIGFISVDRRFRWVRHKDFETAILESRGANQ